MLISSRVPLKPNKAQSETLGLYAGASRRVWNWGLEECLKDIDGGKIQPTAWVLSKRLVLMKKTPEWSWLYFVSKSVAECSLAALDAAWQDCFERIKGRPKFKARGQQNGFEIYGRVSVSMTHIRVPKLGWIRLGREGHLPIGKLNFLTIAQRHGTWYVSVRKEVPEVERNGKPAVGVDVGVVNLITTSCGVAVKNPRTLKRNMRKLKTLHRSLSRKKKGSKNRSKAKIRLARKHEKVANIRKTNLNRISKVLTTSHSFIGIEDLRVSQMTRKGKKQRKKSLNQSMMDASFSELRRQLEYKGKLYGCKVVAVDPAYTSQCCSQCGFISRENRKTQSAFECVGCGYAANADVNAAVNILAKAVATDHEETINACGSRKKTAPARKRRLGVKQEKNSKEIL